MLYCAFMMAVIVWVLIELVRTHARGEGAVTPIKVLELLEERYPLGRDDDSEA